MIWVWNLSISIIITIMLLPFWFSKWSNDSSIQIIVSVVILPVLLVAFNVFLHFKNIIKISLRHYIVLSLVCIFQQILQYISWGVWSGNLFNPDNETLLLTKVFSVISVGICVSLMFFSHIILKITKKI